MKRKSMSRVVVAVVGLCVVAGSVPALGQGVTGRSFACGRNDCGQVGDGTTTDRSLPVSVSGLSGVTSIGGGGVGTVFAVKTDGSVWAWGHNYCGTIGDGTVNNSSQPYGKPTPVNVTSLSNFTAFSVGSTFTLGRKSDGSVWAWGRGQWGELGNGEASLTVYPTPGQVLNLSGVIAIAAGYQHALALKSNGSVWAWGSTWGGAIGDGSSGNGSKVTPVQALISDVTAISAGTSLSIALKADGSVWTWGYNNYGQLGDGTTTPCYTPKKLVTISNVIHVAAGLEHAIAVKSDGSVWTWGRNQHGQLGDGTSVDKTAPVPVAGLSGVIAISAGYDHTAAVKSDGTVWTWGRNVYGQLGDGTTGDQSRPVQMKGDLVNATGVVCGSGCTAVLAGSQAGSIMTAPGMVAVPEGGTVSFQAKLAMRPAGDVAVTVARTAGDTGITVQAGANLIFTPANWDTYQTVTLAAVADGNSGIAAILLSAPGLLYSLVNAVDVAGGGGNQPPVVVSAAWAEAATVTLPAGTTMHVVASDPDGDPLTYAWSKVSGAGTATFATPAAADSGVTFSAAGAYVLRVTVTDGRGGSVASEATVAALGDVDPRADCNGDGVVNALDLQLVIANFGKTVP